MSLTVGIRASSSNISALGAPSACANQSVKRSFVPATRGACWAGGGGSLCNSTSGSGVRSSIRTLAIGSATGGSTASTGGSISRSATLNGALAAASRYNSSKGSAALVSGGIAAFSTGVTGVSSSATGCAAAWAGGTGFGTGSVCTAVPCVTGKVGGAARGASTSEAFATGSTGSAGVWATSTDGFSIVGRECSIGLMNSAANGTRSTGFLEISTSSEEIATLVGVVAAVSTFGSSAGFGISIATAGFSASLITRTTSSSAVLRTTCIGANGLGALPRVRSKSTARDGSCAAGEVLRSFASTSPALSSPTANNKRAPLNHGKRSARSRRSAKSLRDTSPGVPNSSVKRSRSISIRRSEKQKIRKWNANNAPT